MDGANGDLPPENEKIVQNLTDDTNLKKIITSDNGSKSLSSVLIVNNLVRPFTLTGLKKTLSKCGKIMDDKFWLNKEKTKCYVRYANETIADESRKYINSVKWPASNPNTLESNFGSTEELDELLRRDEEERIQLERERKEAAESEAVKHKQVELKQQSKEESTEKFNDSLIGNDVIIEQQTNGDSTNAIDKMNNSINKSANTKEDGELARVREVSPPKNAVTNVLYITNLVRGFTDKQFKELLSKHGTLIDEKFWMDKLKSRCYVVYESTDDASKARNAIHGLKWPRANTNALKADFGKLSDVNELLSGESIKTTKDEKPTNKDKANDPPQNEPDLAVKQQDESKENVNENRKKSPAKNQVSCIVYVNGLSRPFTQAQLNEILCEDGVYDEKRFWIDKVKSQCYAAYENEEIAIKTRERLHGFWWPKGNNRKLVADFASEKELENKLNLVRLDTASREMQQQQKAKDEEQRSKENLDRNSDKHQIDHKHEISNDENKRHEKEMQVDTIETQEHVGLKRRRDRSSSPSVKKREHRMEQSPREQYLHKANHVKESPGKTLETLFKKTKTTPSIYWMPLTEDGMKLRDELREKERIDRAEREERNERNRKEAAERMRSYNEYNGNRRRSPLRREPYHSSRNYGPPMSRYPPERDRFMMERRPVRSPARMDKRMIDRPLRELRTPERMLRPIRTPSRSPARRSLDKKESRGRRRTLAGRDSRSRSGSSSARSTKSSRASSSSGSRRRSPARRSPEKSMNKRPMLPSSPRSPIRRHSRSPPRRYSDKYSDRRLPPTRR